MTSYLLLVLCCVLYIANGTEISNPEHQSKRFLNPKLVKSLLDNDFEDGRLGIWYDSSPNQMNWQIEDFDSPTEIDNPAPEPDYGTKYLRVHKNGEFGLGRVVLNSEVFLAEPGDEIHFSFWIRAKYAATNNLQVMKNNS